MTIDDIEYKDAVFAIPKNSVEVVLNITTYENGELYKIECQCDLQDIQDCFKCFDDTVAGDYPKYIFTEKGREWLNAQTHS